MNNVARTKLTEIAINHALEHVRDNMDFINKPKFLKTLSRTAKSGKNFTATFATAL